MELTNELNLYEEEAALAGADQLKDKRDGSKDKGVCCDSCHVAHRQRLLAAAEAPDT